jgi:hypothetical protein
MVLFQLSTLWIVAVVIVFVLIYIRYSRRKRSTKYCIKDGCYQVAPLGEDDKYDSAMTLKKIVQNLKTVAGASADLTVAQYNSIREIVRKQAIHEHLPAFGESSFFDLRNRNISMCLRQRPYGDDEFGNIHDFNTIMFVVLHEIAHVARGGVSHDRRFWANFGQILLAANSCNVIRLIDYSKYPTRYCGVHVNYNPTFDMSLDLSDI